MTHKIRDIIFSAGGRKFIIGLVAAFWMKGCNSFLLWFDKIDSESYVKLEDVTMWIILGLFTANVATKAFDRGTVPPPGEGERNDDEDERDSG